MISNAEFMSAVFGDTNGTAQPIVVSFSGAPKDVGKGAWIGRAWANGRPELSPNHNNYTAFGTFVQDAEGRYRRTKAQSNALHAVMLDDIGSKVPADRISLEPSWIIETSKGNFQYGYILDEPLADADEADRLLAAIIDGGLTDPGANGPCTRLGRLPVGVNGKYVDASGAAWHCKLTEWQPERRYSVSEIRQGLQLAPKETRIEEAHSGDTDALKAAMEEAGLTPPDTILPGKTARFSTNGDSADTAGWVYLFPDEQGAVFGDWRSGEQHTWQTERQMSEAELEQFWETVESARETAEKAREAEYRDAALHAQLEWELANLAPDTHPYLVKKGIRPNGARIDYNGWLIIPVLGPDGNIQSLQRIAPDGTKRFMKGGKISLGHVWLGEKTTSDTVLLCEGFATGDSLYQATGYPVCVCFSASNLKPVAESLRNESSTVKLLICGDDDNTKAGGNTGRTKATQAARASAASVVFPTQGGDFNDMAQDEGLESVQARIEQALSETKLMPLAFQTPTLAGTDARDGTHNTRPLSELGNAMRLMDAHGENIRFVSDARAWVHWREGAWAWDLDGARTRGLAAMLPGQIYNEGALHLADSEYFAKWSRQSQKQNTLEAAVSLLSNFESIRLPMALMDSDPFKIGFDNARMVIDLRTGLARPAQQSDLITKSIKVDSLGETAKAVHWTKFIGQIFNEDDELIDWFHRWCGYLLTGSTNEQIFVFLFGLGSNGKGVLSETLRHIMGDYARAADAGTFTEGMRQSNAASPDMADLIGARLAITTETEEGIAFSEARIKAITGQDTITTRKLYQNSVQFTPQFKLMMSGNHKPIIKGCDFGIWRRVRLIPFTRQFSDMDKDPNLLAKLRAESAHILAWMVDGCLEWHKCGLSDVPRVVAAATGEYKEDQDIVGRWLEECCEFGPGLETSNADLYDSYQAWCKANGLKPVSSIALGRRLSERVGHKSDTISRGVRGWRDIALKNPMWAAA